MEKTTPYCCLFNHKSDRVLMFSALMFYMQSGTNLSVVAFLCIL